MSDITIQRCVAVGWGTQKPWVITDSHCIDGVEFVVLNKRDHGFVRFAIAEGGDVSDNPFLHSLRHLRNQATIDAMAPAMPTLFDVPEPASSKDVKRMRRAHDKPAVVHVTLPGFTSKSGEEIPPCPCKCKANFNATALVAVELQTSVLQHIQRAIAASSTSDDDDTNGAAEHVYWRKDKMCYIAWRPRGAGKKRTTKTFRPAAAQDGAALQQAKTRAEEWASHGEAATESEDEVQDEDTPEDT